MNTRVFRRSEISMGIQNASTWGIRKTNEVDDARNVRFNKIIGAAVRRLGYKKEGNKFSASNKKPTGGHTAQFTSGTRRFVACNAEDDSFTLVKVQETNGSWTTIINDIPANSEVFFTDFRNEVFVSGYDIATGNPFKPYNINSSLNVSTTRNLLFAPWCKYFVVYRGVMYATNVRIGTENFPDRLYRGSAPTGPITFVKGPQINSQAPVTLVDQVPAMTDYTLPKGVASASSEINTSTRAWMAFNRSIDRWIASTNTNQWLKYDFGAEPKIITFYSIMGEAYLSDINRSPKTWRLEASNDNTTWVNLDTRTDQPVWTSVAEERTFSISNTTSYRYYRLFVESNHGSDYIAVGELKLFNSLQGVKPLQLKLDSVRYVKPGMELEIYKAGKPIRLFPITVYDVDKPTDVIQFMPENYPFTANASTDLLTFADASNMPTGTPIQFSSTNLLPAPLQPNTTYYSIYVSATTIKVATTLDNAKIGIAIDITGTGSVGATQSIYLSYELSNNDEVYIKGRYGLLTTAWNTDYPTADAADFSAIQPGVDSSNAITGVVEATNRLFVFTLNSSNKFDGKTTIPFNRTIGCVSHRTIRNIDDDWVIWLTARGRVYARNEGGGQQEYISRGIHNKLLENIPLNQLRAASAGLNDGGYTVYVGNYNNEPTRAVYDFGSNTWSIDVLSHPSLIYINDNTTEFGKPYFFSNNGYLYMDDTGNMDDDQAIRFELDLGKVDYGTEKNKKFESCFIYSQYAAGLKVTGYIDDHDPVALGSISGRTGQITYPTDGANKPKIGSTIRIKIAGAIEDVPPQVIESFIDYFNLEEEINGYGKEQ